MSRIEELGNLLVEHMEADTETVNLMTDYVRKVNDFLEGLNRRITAIEEELFAFRERDNDPRRVPRGSKKT